MHGLKPLNLENPLVSVVIPCYNQAHYLAESIESVLNQSYNNAEIIVIDDGSKDHTGEVAQQYPKVRYIKQVNQGLSASRNNGLRESTGDLVMFLDSDDRFLPGAFEHSLASFKKQPEIAYTYGGYVFIQADGSPMGNPIRPKDHTDHFLELLQKNIIGMVATVAFRRDVLLEFNGFNRALAACEDYDLYLRIARKYSVVYTSELIAEYRQHGSNMSGNPSLMLKYVLKVLHGQKSYIQSNEKQLAAYKEGIAHYNQMYGDRVMNKIKDHLRNKKELGKMMVDVSILLRYAPTWAVKRQLSRLSR